MFEGDRVDYAQQVMDGDAPVDENAVAYVRGEMLVIEVREWTTSFKKILKD